MDQIKLDRITGEDVIIFVWRLFIGFICSYAGVVISGGSLIALVTFSAPVVGIIFLPLGLLGLCYGIFVLNMALSTKRSVLIINQDVFYQQVTSYRMKRLFIPTVTVSDEYPLSEILTITTLDCSAVSKSLVELTNKDQLFKLHLTSDVNPLDWRYIRIIDIRLFQGVVKVTNLKQELKNHIYNERFQLALNGKLNLIVLDNGVLIPVSTVGRQAGKLLTQQLAKQFDVEPIKLTSAEQRELVTGYLQQNS